MRKQLIMIFIVVFALFACSASTMAASEGRIIYVNNATGDNTGSSWGNAFTTLQAALDVAQPGDEIWVAAGTYKPTSDYGLNVGERGKHFEMKNGVGIYGSFAGTESTRSGRDWTAHPTILSGDIVVEGNNGDNCYHVFYHPAGLALNQTAVLDGFTVTGGNSYDPYSDPWNYSADVGGGMYNTNSSPTLINVTFSGNNARNGGGMYNVGSSPKLTNVTFIGNNTSGYGGRGPTPGSGMCNKTSSPALTNCILWGNSGGPQMCNETSSPALTNCILGGRGEYGIYDVNSTSTVTYSDIQGGWVGEGNINIDPKFVRNPSNDDLGDLRLQADSPCINAGTNVPFEAGGVAQGVTTDLDGNPRIMGGNVDMGVLEFQGPFPPTWPSGSSLTASNVTETGLILTWTAATDDVGVTSYKIYKNGNILDTVNLDTVDGTPTPYNVTGLTAGTHYTFKVEAGDAAGTWSTTGPSVTVTGLIYVNCNDTGDNTGSSWGNAFTTLQAALNVAQPGDLIWVAAGTYKPTSDYGRNPLLGTGIVPPFENLDERSKHFEMKNGVGIYGGFAGTESTRSGRDRTAHPTILSGDIGVEGDASDNCYHVFYHPGGLALNQTAVMDGFTVTGGDANYYLSNFLSSNFHDRGGGMCNEKSSPTLNNVTFSGNSTSGGGGGMWNYNSHPTLTNVTFSNNSSDNSGGGMENYNSHPALTNVTFSNNSCHFGGAGMYNMYSSPKLTNVTFSGNRADIGGGMYNVNSSTPTLTNVTFSGNSAGWSGGGMENRGGSPTLTNVTFSVNSAIYGGGMYNSINGSPTLTNCILWGNSGIQIYDTNDSTATVTYSDIQGGWVGEGNINTDPKFVRNPGNDDFGDLRLRADSPCINAGTNVPFEAGGVAQDVTTDLDCNPRIIGDRVDMGAYEAEAGITDLISKFQKLSTQQVKDALAIGQRIIESDTIPDILSPAQKSLLNNLGLTNAQVKSAYNSVMSQLDTEEKIKDLQSGDLTKLANFLITVEGSFDPDLRKTLAAKGITVSKVVKFALDISKLTFDSFSNIPKADLEAILEGDLGIASATAASYGLNWANIETLRDSLHPPEKRKLIDILITIGNLGDNANLSGLTLSTGTLDPVFAPDTTEYTAIVGSDVNGFTVTPTTADANAAVEVNKKTVQSGTASETISFSGNSRRVKVTVTVTAPSGTEKKYTLTVLKPK